MNLGSTLQAALEIPPFLMVDAKEQARRNEWAKEHPIVIVKAFGGTVHRGPHVDPAEKARIDALNEAERQTKRASMDALKSAKAQDWVATLPAAERRWSTRLGRWVPESIIGLDKMRLVDALKAIEALARKAHAPEENARRRLKTRVEHATATRHAKPVAAAPAAPRKAKAAPGKVTGTAADTITLEMLRLPDGVTQDELAARLESTGDAARGRISKVGRANNLTIKRIKEQRGGVYRIAK